MAASVCSCRVLVYRVVMNLPSGKWTQVDPNVLYMYKSALDSISIAYVLHLYMYYI